MNDPLRDHLMGLFKEQLAHRMETVPCSEVNIKNGFEVTAVESLKVQTNRYQFPYH